MNTIINNAIKFLSKEQTKNGSFPSFTTSNPKDFKNAYKCESIFASTLILDSLKDLQETQRLKKIKNNLIIFLLSQKSEDWSFNYIVKNSNDYKKTPYPDDLDDTSCALAALYRYDKKLISGEVIAKFVLILTALEKQEGGPYKTWLVGPNTPKIWHDIDLAVNSNIAFFLSTQQVSLKNINKFKLPIILLG